MKLDKGFQEIDSFSSYINPYPVLMTPGASEANGITMEFLADKPKEFEVIPAFAEFCGEAGFLAYNDSFDVSMLGTAHGRLGIEQNIDSFDVLRMARDAMVSENNKLRTVAEALDVVPETKTSTRAMFDVRMTIAVFLKLKEILKEKAEKEAQKNAPQTVLFGGELSSGRSASSEDLQYQPRSRKGRRSACTSLRISVPFSTIRFGTIGAPARKASLWISI